MSYDSRTDWSTIIAVIVFTIVLGALLFAGLLISSNQDEQNKNMRVYKTLNFHLNMEYNNCEIIERNSSYNPICYRCADDDRICVND